MGCAISLYTTTIYSQLRGDLSSSNFYFTATPNANISIRAFTLASNSATIIHNLFLISFQLFGISELLGQYVINVCPFVNS